MCFISLQKNPLEARKVLDDIFRNFIIRLAFDVHHLHIAICVTFHVTLQHFRHIFVVDLEMENFSFAAVSVPHDFQALIAVVDVIFENEGAVEDDRGVEPENCEKYYC